MLRSLLFVAAYLTCCVAITYAIRWAVRYADDTQPGRFFYHLEPDEAPGPIGDPDLLGWAILLDYIGFLALVVPVAWVFGLRWRRIAPLAVLQVPVMLIEIAALVTAGLF